MIIIISHCQNEYDIAMNLTPVENFMKKYNITYNICTTLDELHRHKPKKIRGFILCGGILDIMKIKGTHFLTSDDVCDDEFSANYFKKFELGLYVLRHYPKKPIYGICLGCQIIHFFHGGKFIKRYDYRLNNTFPIRLDGKNFHYNKKLIDGFVGFVNYPIGETVSDLIPTAWSVNTSEPVAYRHQTKPWISSMYHPEKNINTHWILLNFIEFCCMYKP